MLWICNLVCSFRQLSTYLYCPKHTNEASHLVNPAIKGIAANAHAFASYLSFLDIKSSRNLVKYFSKLLLDIPPNNQGGNWANCLFSVESILFHTSSCIITRKKGIYVADVLTLWTAQFKYLAASSTIVAAYISHATKRNTLLKWLPSKKGRCDAQTLLYIMLIFMWIQRWKWCIDGL